MPYCITIFLLVNAIVVPIACDNSNGKSSKNEEPPHQNPKTTPWNKSDYGVQECQARRDIARTNGCVDEKGWRALKVLEVAPVCNAEGDFSHWEPCEHEAIKEIREILRGIEDCPKSGGIGGCALQAIEVRRKLSASPLKAARVMIIDGFSPFPAWRHRSRIVDVLTPDPLGYLKSESLTDEIPTAMKSIAILLDEKYPWLSPRSLSPIAGIYKAAFGKNWHWSIQHGTVILNQLAELNPKTEFVLVEMPETNMKDVCLAREDPLGMSRLREFVRNYTRTLVTKIKEHEVEFVSMSFGKTMSTILDRRNPECALPVEILESVVKIYFEEYFYPLSMLHNVIIVQASASSEKQLKKLQLEHLPLLNTTFDYRSVDDLDNLTDCVEFPNRIRVGKTSRVKPAISVNGSSDFAFIDDLLFLNAKECTDLYLNDGGKVRFADILEERKANEWVSTLWMSTDGIFSEPSPITGSSFVAPLAISYIMHLKRMDPSLTPKQLIEKVKSGGKIKDPLQHELHLLNVFGSDDFQDVIAKHSASAD